MGNIDTPSPLALGPPPRKARLRRGIRNMRRAYRTVFTLLILVLGGWALLDGLRLYELTYDTAATTGKITRKEAVHKGPPSLGAREHRLHYVFATQDGTPIDGEASVAAEVFEAAKEEGPCTVVYLPNHPGQNWLNDNFAARTYPRSMMINRGLVALIALIVLVWIGRPPNRELHLARYGEVVQGQILVTGKGRRRRARPWITYSFCTANGVTMQGRCTVPRNTPAEARAAGTVIEVLYDPRRPEMNKARLGLDFVEFV